MKTIALDIETFSPEPITHGVYKYAAHPEFKILLVAYSVDGGPVQLVDLDNGEHIPAAIIKALQDPGVENWAFNANFERVCLSRHLLNNAGFLDPAGWRCSMIWSSALGLPTSLDAVGKALNLKLKKLTTGKDLIKFFCLPAESKTAPQQTDALLALDQLQNQTPRRTRARFPADWDAFRNYNIRDVETENELRAKLSVLPLPDQVWGEYETDQRINDHGVRIDLDFAKAAMRIDDAYRTQCLDEAQELTGLVNPNSPTQALTWLNNNGLGITDLRKDTVSDAIDEATGTVKRVLELRQELSRSSVKKYQAMLDTTSTDGRAHGLLQFYGAGRTGRWAGRKIQVQNLPRNYLTDLDDARRVVAEGDVDLVEVFYDSVPDTLSQLIRTAFIPRPGTRFIVADYSAIEARVLAWLAGEEETLQAFREGKDLYCVTASSMFGVPVEKHGPNAELRQKGKVATLACIAEGQLVLTDQGEIPIERVTTSHKVWDGSQWVHHDGVLYKGNQTVFTYQGLTATSDHLVWAVDPSTGKPQEEPVAFGFAMMYRLQLVHSGTKPEGEYPPIALRVGKRPVYDIVNAGPRNRYTVSGKLVHNCGYQGGENALKAMGALRMGIPEGELKPIVDAWRQANPNIVNLWNNTNQAAINAIKHGGHTYPINPSGITCRVVSGMLTITLPSGRRLVYPAPRIGRNRFGQEAVTFKGVGENRRFVRGETYGGKLVENITQAVARDVLARALGLLESLGHTVVFHVHDEVVVEAPPETTVDEICRLLSVNPPWADGLPLAADGFECDYYQKD